jgi:hypothetical protein
MSPNIDDLLQCGPGLLVNKPSPALNPRFLPQRDNHAKIHAARRRAT